MVRPGTPATHATSAATAVAAALVELAGPYLRDRYVRVGRAVQDGEHPGAFSLAELTWMVRLGPGPVHPWGGVRLAVVGCP